MSGTPVSRDWTTSMLVKGDGSVRKTCHNTSLIIANHSSLAGKLGYNEMTAANEIDGTPVDEIMVSRLRELIEVEYG